MSSCGIKLFLGVLQKWKILMRLYARRHIIKQFCALCSLIFKENAGVQHAGL
jgi:hypothetical protein